MADVALEGRFDQGTKVGLYDRVGDWFHPEASKPVKTVTIPKTGSNAGVAAFEGVDAGPYWIAAEADDGTWVAVKVSAREEPQTVEQVAGARKLSPEQVRERLAQTRPPDTEQEVVVGARSTSNAKPAEKTQAREGARRLKVDGQTLEKTAGEEGYNVPPFGEGTERAMGVRPKSVAGRRQADSEKPPSRGES
jgi:hypothetical protein